MSIFSLRWPLVLAAIICLACSDAIGQSGSPPPTAPLADDNPTLSDSERAVHLTARRLFAEGTLDDDTAAVIVAGRWNLINFWGTWCPPCRQELEDFYVEIGLDFEERGGRFVTVALEDDETVADARTYMRKLGVPESSAFWFSETPSAEELDPRLGFFEDQVPYSVLVSPDGYVVWTHLGEIQESDLIQALETSTGMTIAGQAAQDPGRRALLIGINDYNSESLRPPTIEPGSATKTSGRKVWFDLGGAVTDARAMQEMLISRYGFAPHHVELLTDQDATRAAILQAIERHLIAPAKKGDHIVFYFAGHGSQMENPTSDEEDLLDETLVPADSRWGAADIRDKELRRRFNKILGKGARLTVILDSCYSGSAARGLPRWTRTRGLKPDLRQMTPSESSNYGRRPEEHGALILSASQDNQLAWETRDENNQDRGAFSLALLRAMRDSGPMESAEHVFLRAKARLWVEETPQQPVLAGGELMRQSELFGGRVDHHGVETVVAVRDVATDGTTVYLEGGWANGLTVGSELRMRDENSGGEVLLRVTALEGMASSTAEIVRPPDGEVTRSGIEMRSPAPTLTKGSLVELTGWASPPGPPLKVWIPQTSEDFRGFASNLRSAVEEAGISWSADPIEGDPTHVLSWRKGSWYLSGPEGDPEELGTQPSSSTVVEELRESSDARLFVHLPAPTSLEEQLEIGSGTPNDAVEPIDDPSRADYFLVGRLHGGKTEYAWVRPAMIREDQKNFPLPLRSDWYSLTPAAVDGDGLHPVERLERTVLQLAKLRAWLGLESPPGNDFPYELVLKFEDGSVATKGQLPTGARLGLVLRLRDKGREAVVPRYIYVFTIDSHGKSTLLFPLSAQGSVENRLPVRRSGPGSLPRELKVGDHPLFAVSKPLGVDTYFLLTTNQPLPNPWVLEYPGIRVRGPKGKTALEELLSLTGATTRSSERLVTPTSWSLERSFFESVDQPQ